MAVMQTMENSMTKDYVTEKVYDGLVAGCVPIYLGAPNIDKYIPDSNAIVDYARFGTPAALKEELERLARDQAAYEQKLLWKVKAQRRWNPGESLCCVFDNGTVALAVCFLHDSPRFVSKGASSHR